MISSWHRSYRSVFRLHVKHDYYADGCCPDFSIEPSKETSRLLRKIQGVFKVGPGWISAHLDPGFRQLHRGDTFVFQLRLRNPEFAFISDTTNISAMTAPIFTSEGAEPATDEDGNPKAHTLVLALADRPPKYRESFAVMQPSAEDRFTLSGQPAPAAEFKIEESDSITGVRDYDEGTKVITVNSSAASQGDRFTVTYPVLPHRPADVLAEVEIRVDDDWPDANQADSKPLAFEVHFAPRSTYWIYYLISDRTNLIASELRIQDQDESISFPDDRRTELASPPDSSDEIASWLARRYPDPEMLRVRFVSESPVACRQTARKRIQLVNDTNRLSSSLPNPALDNLALNPLGGESARAGDSLFQIVTFLTHSFPNSGE